MSALEERLAEINPAAARIRVIDGVVAPDDLFDAGLYNPATKIPDVDRWLKEEAFAGPDEHDHDHDHGHHDVNRHDDNIRAFCITYDEPVRLDAVEQWFDLIMLLKGPDLLRVKGIVNVIGMDVVEVAPAYDVGEITALAASHLAMEMLYLYANRTSA